MHTTPEKEILSCFLPEKVFQYFDVISGEKTDTHIIIVLEEKNDPPLEKRHDGLPIKSKGFYDITISDFPARGRRVDITFRRRRWQVGNELLTRNIPIAAEGTRLELEFALFLKEHLRHSADSTCDNRAGEPAASERFRSDLP